MKHKKDQKEDLTPDPRRFTMVPAYKVTGYEEQTPEEREKSHKILLSFIDGSRLKDNNK